MCAKELRQSVQPNALDLEAVVAWQRQRQQEFRETPTDGLEVPYRDRLLRVYPNVFRPFEDSLPLVETMKIRPGDKVLDMGTGAGVIAIYAALQGASRVMAVDVNPCAVRTTDENAGRHGVGERVFALESDVYNALNGDRFDVITANLPWLDRPAADLVQASQWDTGFNTNRRFLFGLREHLVAGGRAYVAQGNYGALEKFRATAIQARLLIRQIGLGHFSENPSLEFYALELRPE